MGGPNAITFTSLLLDGWRGLAPTELEPHPAFNVIHGDNAEGKTSLLEAVYFTGRLRSFRDVRLQELIRHGGGGARLCAGVDRAGLPQSVDVRLVEGRRVVRVDGKAVRRVADHCEHYKVVLFVPEDIYLPSGAPSVRRRFLDRALYNLEPAMLVEAQEYAAVLRRRNALLRAGGPGLDAGLAAYDEALVRSGSRLAARRLALVRSFSVRAGRVFRAVFGDQGTVSMEYRSTVPGLAEASTASELAALFRRRLAEVHREDVRRGVTTVGPHLDDVAMLLDGRLMGDHASQGQHRVLVLALKVTEIELVVEQTGVVPVLLLDDISSELDRRRNAQLFDYLKGVRGQVFLTTTSPELVGLEGPRAAWHMERGVACRSS